MKTHISKSVKITQPKAGRKGTSLAPPPFQRKANNTGLPDQLKSGVESLSGIDISDVKVHYNSSQPAQLNAHAYAQGNQIHVAPGQEKHLPHEAWHVVQQKQGRVKPTMQLRGKVNVNDDVGLEKEADVMGSRALGAANTVQRQKTNGINLDTGALIQRGRKEDEERETGVAKYVIKAVLPGSGDDDWRTHKNSHEHKGTRVDDLSDTNAPTTHVAKKIGTKFTWTVSGPGAPLTKGAASHVGGISDRGSNSIENNKRVVPQYILDNIAAYRSQYGDGAKPILILIKAHSRNAVAGTQIAIRIREATRHDSNVKIELVAFDPVPGPGHSGSDLDVDISSIPNSTVVYSVATQYPTGFTPQRVLGAKRIIVSRQNHSAGLEAGFRYAGKVYTGSQLNSLPTGVFVDSNSNGSNVLELLKIDSIEDALHNLEYEFNDSESTTRDVGRLSIISSVLQHYFFYHRPPNQHNLSQTTSRPLIRGLDYKKSKND